MASNLTLQSTVKLNTGYHLPLLGLGVYDSVDQLCVEACTAAFKAGYRHVDSAIMYGNQDRVGKAIVESGMKREDVFITTKVSSEYAGYDEVTTKVDESLKLLGSDYIDLYLIHDPFMGKANRLESWKALIEAKSAGKIRSIGVSNYGVAHLEEIKAAGLEIPSVNQLEIHPLCQQKSIVEYCKTNGIVVEAYCPIIRGDFSLSGLAEMAEKYKKDPAQVLIRWSLQKGYVPLPKSSKAERIASNANIYDFELSKEDVDHLDSLDKGDAGAISWNPVNVP